MIKKYFYSISADGGKTWTKQYLADVEAKSEVAAGHIVKRNVMQKCECCGALFRINYCSDGTYEYGNDICDCEADFHPAFDSPSLSEFLAMLEK